MGIEGVPLRLKRVTERTLPWGTPNSWSCGLERTVPIRTRKCQFERKLAMKMGKRASDTQVVHNAVLPCRVVRLFEVEEHGDGMLLSDEGVTKDLVYWGLTPQQGGEMMMMKESFKPDQGE